ncbi:hypothetical protein LJC18_03490 [Lachnospiraceae bacterium OttesenSCG-928-E19]|nr:hypothetical protein [Lachnospiraceae bacterium OttesenSCG-928-E19]
MKRILIFLGVFIPISANAVPAVVDYIFDGDTFAGAVMLQDSIKITVRVRIINIDAPEMSGECQSEIDMAIKSRDRLAELIPVGSVVELDKLKDDKYLGRIDAAVKTVDGHDVGEILIRSRLARPYSGGKRTTWCNTDGSFKY